MSIVHESPATHVTSEVVVERDALRVVRLGLPPGESLPAHAVPTDLVLVVVEGTGRLTLGDRELTVEPGAVVAISPNEVHSIVADERLQLVLVQARLEAPEALLVQTPVPSRRAGRRKSDQIQAASQVIDIPSKAPAIGEDRVVYITDWSQRE